MIRRTACLIARGTDPYRNLAIEKHLMDTLPEDTAILYLWQNQHTIVIGRNQNPWSELKVDEFLENGGTIARRLSGGGAVYHDVGNLNFTFILPKTEFDISRQLNVIGMAVGAFGVQVEISGRNDLHASGRKFSGNAFYKAGSAAYHHGTLMVNCNMNVMQHYLTVDPKKLEQRGVKSVPSRVVNLKDLCADITIETLQQSLCLAFEHVYRAKPAWLDERMMDVYSLQNLTDQFAGTEWIYPESIPYSFSVDERFPWGGVSVKILSEGGIIRSAKIFTDAMEAVLFHQLEKALVGSPFLISAIAARFDQKLKLLSDPRLLQVAGDVCTLICGRIRSMDRGGGGGASHN
ncbi:MAG: lipoate--protein ligase [Clostridiales bacterium]|nr:lipoate--protein ligase [Clostridiales bacterium]